MKVLILVGKVLLALLAVVLLYVGFAIVLSLVPTRPEPVSGIRAHQVYISSNGVHTDFILPAAVVPEELLNQIGYLADYPFIAFGWGDKGFYLDTPTWADLKASTAIRAMFLPSPTAMHVTGYRLKGRKWAPVDLTAGQLATLNAYIATGFQRDEAGHLHRIDAPGYGDDDEFFEAEGFYNAVYTCNNWINEGLKAAKVRTAVWAPSEWGIMRWRKSPAI